MSRIARKVHAIERHDELAELARERMARLGYDNVVIRLMPRKRPASATSRKARGSHSPKPKSHRHRRRTIFMASNPEIPSPDTIEPQSTPETPPLEQPPERPVPDSPANVPATPEQKRHASTQTGT